MFTELDMWVEDVRQGIYYDHIMQNRGVGFKRFLVKVYRQIMFVLGFVEIPTYNQHYQYLDKLADEWMSAKKIPVDIDDNIHAHSAIRQKILVG